MGGKKRTAGFLFIAFCALSCASVAIAASDAPVNEAMQASGGLTFGSAALIALAGAIVTFGKARANTRNKISNSRDQRTALHGRP